MQRFFLSILFILFRQSLAAQSAETPYVLLVSFDGFRNDYVEKFQTPNFKTFIEGGVASAGLIPSFPSKTFPNHYSIITGMYPGTHGLVDNNFFDKATGTLYKISNREAVENPAFYGGLPLWRLAQQNGLKTASFFWVGSEAPIQGQFPTYYYKYDERISNEDRVDQAIRWLQLPTAERPHLIALYFSLVDDAGHDFGPNSPELGQAVLMADNILGRLITGLDTTALPVNVILCSDHGMLEMKTVPETYIILDQLAGYSDTTLQWVNSGTHIHIYTKRATQDRKALKQLRKSLQRANQPFQVWFGKRTPKRWHYRHPRAGDLFLLADPGHYFTTQAAFEKIHRTNAQTGSKTWGTHGFDPYVCSEMQGIFYAKGPNILKGKRLPALSNIHIYPLVALLLDLPIPSIDGDASLLREIIWK